MKHRRNVNVIEKVAQFGYTKQKESNSKLLRRKSILCFRDDGLRIETSLKGQRLYIGEHPVNLNDCSLRSAY